MSIKLTMDSSKFKVTQTHFTKATHVNVQIRLVTKENADSAIRPNLQTETYTLWVVLDTNILLIYHKVLFTSMFRTNSFVFNLIRLIQAQNEKQVNSNRFREKEYNKRTTMSHFWFSSASMVPMTNTVTLRLSQCLYLSSAKTNRFVKCVKVTAYVLPPVFTCIKKMKREHPSKVILLKRRARDKTRK